MQTLRLCSVQTEILTNFLTGYQVYKVTFIHTHFCTTKQSGRLLKHLDAVVFPVAYQNVVLGVHSDSLNSLEFPICASPSPNRLCKFGVE